LNKGASGQEANLLPAASCSSRSLRSLRSSPHLRSLSSRFSSQFLLHYSNGFHSSNSHHPRRKYTTPRLPLLLCYTSQARPNGSQAQPLLFPFISLQLTPSAPPTERQEDCLYRSRIRRWTKSVPSPLTLQTRSIVKSAGRHAFNDSETGRVL
jgi:hypothetical protein